MEEKGQTIELKISGMTCVSHVAKVLQSAPGVEAAVVDLAGGRVQGVHLDVAAIVALVEEEGYSAQESRCDKQAQPNFIALTLTGCSCCG